MAQAALELTKEPTKPGVEGTISILRGEDMSNVACMHLRKVKMSEKGNFLKNCMGNQCDIYLEIIKRRF